MKRDRVARVVDWVMGGVLGLSLALIWIYYLLPMLLREGGLQ